LFINVVFVSRWFWFLFLYDYVLADCCVYCCTRALYTFLLMDFFPVLPVTHTHANFLSIHLLVCLTTGPKPLPKRALHTVRSRAYSFKWEYSLFPWRSSSRSLRLLPRLPVTFISPFIFPSIICCRRQFLRKMWPIHFAFRLLI
jgi:hypothetical protein